MIQRIDLNLEAFDVVFDVTKRIPQESESEQGDKTYLVRTDLVGQVLLSMMTLFQLDHRLLQHNDHCDQA